MRLLRAAVVGLLCAACGGGVGGTGGGSGGATGGGSGGATGGGSGGATGGGSGGATGGGSGGAAGGGSGGATGGGSGGATGGGSGGATGGGSGGATGGGSGGATGGGSGGATGGGSGGGIGGGSGGAPGSANLWVDPTGGTCVRTASPSAWTDATACASLQAAFAACQSGDTVVIKTGTYAAQNITAIKTAPGCTAIGEPGVTFASLSFGGAYLTLRDVTLNPGNGHGVGGLSTSGTRITLERVPLRGAYASAYLGGSYVTWRNSEFGTAGQTGGKRSCNSADGEPVTIQSADHLLLDGITFHPQDFDPTPCASSSNGFHLEMVRVDHDTDFFTLQNSTFEDGDHSNTASVFITNVNGDPGDPAHLVFQNNDFGSADNTSFSIHQNVTNCSTFTWAYNTFRNSPGDPTSNGCTTTTGMRWIGNLGSRAAFYVCSGTHQRNLWQDSQTYTCGTDAVVIGTRYGVEKLGMVDGGFALTATSPAIDKAEDGGYCVSELGAVDHDGTVRPRGTACDVGAHER